MYLKNLTLKGFKSFAAATTIGFEPGVTVVVGPNGSGKSNVVDAIAWVLGAQAPSAVRSQRMDDVIFAGTARRAALGRAEVILTIDNSSGLLPVELSEVQITRTLFRSGESTYSLNNVPCRLLDVAELLSDTGVGRRQHVIVSQGQMDAVLNASPEDRRAIVEEAAGILKYRKRKERAEHRLTAIEGDLTRAKDLVREVRRQLRPLEKQADAARRHSDLMAELQALRVHLSGREIARLRESLRQLGQVSTTRACEERAVRSELEELTRSVAADEQRLAAGGTDDLGDVLVRLEALWERAQGLAAVVAERRRGLDRERAASISRDVIADLEAEADRCRRELVEVREAMIALEPRREELTSLQAELTAARARLESLERRSWGSGPRPGRPPDPSSPGGPVGMEESLAGELASARAARARADRKAAAETSALREAEAELFRVEARVEALALVLAGDGDRAPDTEPGLDGFDGVLGWLNDLIEVDEGAEAAVAAALGAESEAVVLRDVPTARRILEELPARPAMIPPAGTGSGFDRPVLEAGLHRLRDRVRARAPGIDGLLDALLRSVVIVDDDWRKAAEVAVENPDLVVVTPAGDRFSSRSWRLGSGSSSSERAAFDEAVAQADAARAVYEQAETGLAAARAALVERDVQVASLDEGLQRERGRLREEARAGVEERAAAVATRHSEIEAHSARLDQRRLFLKARLGEIAERLERSAAYRRTELHPAESFESQSAVLVALHEEIGYRVARIEARLSQIREQRRRQSDEARAIVVRLEEGRRRSAAADHRLEALRRAGAADDVKQAELRTNLQNAVEQLRADHRMSPDAAVSAPCPDLDDGVLPHQRVDRLERELEIMGPVNPLALEEYRVLHERHEFLKEQLDDISKARRDLSRVVGTIDTEIESVFSAVFGDVAAGFEVLFETLFPGGRGRIHLTDPDDLLHSGIEISAQPSGKNVKKLSLLSGGERSLTALAFLFAVFRSRPSPFYVLDEVEAALDDVNLHRFLALIDEFRAEAQLVIVSHQKRTMEAADRLYGISMKPGGSSVVVAESISEAA